MQAGYPSDKLDLAYTWCIDFVTVQVRETLAARDLSHDRQHCSLRQHLRPG